MEMFAASPGPELVSSPLSSASGDEHFQPHPVAFHEDVRRSLIGDWKSMFSMGLMEALAPHEPAPEPKHQASSAEARIVGKVMEGVDHIGVAAIRWIESLEDTLTGALGGPIEPLPVVEEEPSAQHLKLLDMAVPEKLSEKRAAPFLKLRDAAVSPSSSSCSDASKIGTAQGPPDPQDFPPLASSSSPALPSLRAPSSPSHSSATYEQAPLLTLVDLSSHASASTSCSLPDSHSLVATLQSQLSESAAKFAKLQASCKLLARKCMKLRRENEELKVLDPMHNVLQAQLTALLADKSRLMQQNEALVRENASLHELLAYASYGANESDAGTCYSPTDSLELFEFHQHLTAEGNDLRTLLPPGTSGQQHAAGPVESGSSSVGAVQQVVSLEDVSLALSARATERTAPTGRPVQPTFAEPSHAEPLGGSPQEHSTLSTSVSTPISCRSDDNMDVLALPPDALPPGGGPEATGEDGAAASQAAGSHQSSRALPDLQPEAAASQSRAPAPASPLEAARLVGSHDGGSCEPPSVGLGKEAGSIMGTMSAMAPADPRCVSQAAAGRLAAPGAADQEGPLAAAPRVAEPLAAAPDVSDGSNAPVQPRPEAGPCLADGSGEPHDDVAASGATVVARPAASEATTAGPTHVEAEPASSGGAGSSGAAAAGPHAASEATIGGHPATLGGAGSSSAAAGQGGKVAGKQRKKQGKPPARKLAQPL